MPSSFNFLASRENPRLGDALARLLADTEDAVLYHLEALGTNAASVQTLSFGQGGQHRSWSGQACGVRRGRGFDLVQPHRSTPTGTSRSARAQAGSEANVPLHTCHRGWSACRVHSTTCGRSAGVVASREQALARAGMALCL